MLVFTLHKVCWLFELLITDPEPQYCIVTLLLISLFANGHQKRLLSGWAQSSSTDCWITLGNGQLMVQN